MFRHLTETAVFCTFLLQNVRFATAACIFSTSELQKVLPDPQFFNIFTCKCTFRHSGIQFCNIRTYKSGPNTSCFVHFHFRMCVSPQRRTIFRHQNLQKCFKHLMFCTCSLQNVLFATAACNFWFLLWAPTSAPAALTGLLLDWPDTRIIEKNTAFRDCSNIWRGCIFFLLTFALLHLFTSDLTTLLCFSTVHIVGSFYLNFLRWTGHDQVDEFLRFEDAYSLEGALVFAGIPTPTRHPLEYLMVLQRNQR